MHLDSKLAHPGRATHNVYSRHQFAASLGWVWRRDPPPPLLPPVPPSDRVVCFKGRSVISSQPPQPNNISLITPRPSDGFAQAAQQKSPQIKFRSMRKQERGDGGQRRGKVG